MKTTLLYKIVAALAICFAFTISAKAQITVPYNIQNNSGCPVTINWQAVKPGCAAVCANMNGVVLTTGSNPISIPAGPCTSSPCDIKIQVTQMGSNPLSPSVNVSAVGGGTTTIPSTPSCPGTHNIGLGLTNATIN